MKTVTMHLIANIENAATLGELHEAIETAETACREMAADADTIADGEILAHDLDVAMTSLPSWGQDYTGDTDNVLSWDGTRILEGEGYADLTITERGDIAHSMPPAWRLQHDTGEWWMISGEGDGSVHAMINRTGDRDYPWEYVVQGRDAETGELVDMDTCEAETSREAAAMAEDAIAHHVLTADPAEVIRLLAGTQQQIADRTGFSQPTISAWRNPDSGQGMARSSRHLILALIGCQLTLALDGCPGLYAGYTWRWRFAC